MFASDSGKLCFIVIIPLYLSEFVRLRDHYTCDIGRRIYEVGIKVLQLSQDPPNHATLKILYGWLQILQSNAANESVKLGLNVTGNLLILTD